MMCRSEHNWVPKIFNWYSDCLQCTNNILKCHMEFKFVHTEDHNVSLYTLDQINFKYLFQITFTKKVYFDLSKKDKIRGERIFEIIHCPECSATGMGQFPIRKLKWDSLRTSIAVLLGTALTFLSSKHCSRISQDYSSITLQ